VSCRSNSSSGSSRSTNCYACVRHAYNLFCVLPSYILFPAALYTVAKHWLSEAARLAVSAQGRTRAHLSSVPHLLTAWLAVHSSHCVVVFSIAVASGTPWPGAGCVTSLKWMWSPLWGR
jgi:hypothetical protein